MDTRVVRHTPTNQKYQVSYKKVRKTKKVGTGKYKPDKWLVEHSDKTRSDDLTEDYITENFGSEFVTFCKNTPASKFNAISGGAMKDSFLKRHVNLIC